MQCRLPRKNNVVDKPSLTWYFDETVSWSKAVTYEATFTCDGQSYDAIVLTYIRNGLAKYYIKYRYKSGDVKTAGSVDPTSHYKFSWNKEVYRTITFDAPPTGDLLTWLNANATLQ